MNVLAKQTALSIGDFHLTIIKEELLIILLGLIIGSVSFAGSMIAWGKLNGKIKDLAFRGQHVTNVLLLLIS